MTAIVWFRDDLRVGDNPALTAAVNTGDPVIAVYVLDEVSPGVRPLGGASRWWLHHSLSSLRADLAALGIPLVLRRGAAASRIPELVTDADADAAFWNRRYGQPERDLDAELKTLLRERGLRVDSFGASLLFEPWTVRTGAGGPYSVFTPFWAACRALPAPRLPLSHPSPLPGPRSSPEGDSLDDWGLLPTAPDWAAGLTATWTPGENAARARLEEFLSTDLPDYDAERDRPDRDVTSRLSPHLRWGEISPHRVWHDTLRHPRAAHHPAAAQKFLSELGWREFAWHTLFHSPDLATTNWRPAFDAFPWPPLDEAALRAWQRGETGIELVDAGMRELWHTGTMHNRVRMVVASLLTKNLLIDWRAGERWFWDTLVDADAASNPFSWQWVAGSGADAAPYFRVFNPDLQARRFDPDGTYRARWLPDGLRPAPIVDLAASRRAALTAYDRVKAAAPARD
ncbi:deoxyribodipyrimidine photo-lyase [Microbacterium sediminicola]|uniref:Deoxyribodipyrimidine photo-lyase n=1 Tax=Microbacterium sediminicola TaxID=415210 RepID=A0ABP4U9G7_9MICO